ncbi:MAG: hypothetical protein ACRD1T_10265 [Acidimicrobiia bacterium]
MVASTPAYRSDDDLYWKMKTSQGGIMLLVRLHADLAEESIEFLRKMAVADVHPDPASMLPPGSRLASTFDWLERKFGPRNALRALVETAIEVLRVPSIP